ncbi:hypothetical protein LPJ78_001567 [Coemansia sp. RSA 989]|nr:hypothetical protein LPJ78_001567 [Coemansia sp. RSA 989]
MADIKLPSDIIDLIVSYATSAPAYDLSDWKEQLSLLAINSQWRALSKSYVLKTIFLSTVVDDNEDNDEVDEQGAELEIQSNISLIMAAHAQQMVQAMDIRIEGSGDITTYIKNAIELLCSHAKIWPNLNSLYINIMLDELDAGNSKESTEVIDFTKTH